MKTVLNYLNRLNSIVENNSDKINLIFRGQSNYEWSIKSSAARRLEKNSVSEKSIGKFDFIRYHNILLNDAKMYGFNHHDTQIFRELTDLELLAKLQHFGGATCLTDFTKNFLISLWFASECNIDVNGNLLDGAVFFIDLNSPNVSKCFETIKSDYINKPIEDLLKFSEIVNKGRKDELFWVWNPETLNNRIIGQDSTFVFSLFPLDVSHYTKIKVNKEDKQDIRYELDKYFNINTISLFSDFYGFANEANNCNSSFYKFSYSSHYDLAKKYIDEGNYQLALENSNKGIDCIENCKTCTINKRKCEKRILGDLYYFKAKSLHFLNEKEEAITNYLIAIKLNSDYFEDAYFKITDIYYDFADNDTLYFMKALDVMKELNNRNSCLASFISILELSILAENKGDFNMFIKISIENTLVYRDNGKYIIDFFNIVGQSVFNKKSLSIDDFVKRLENSKIDNFSFYFYWNFEDIDKYLTKKELNHFLDMSSRLKERQEIWLKSYYNDSECS